jgi:TldD protein
LKKIGLDAVGETKVTTSHPDILFKVDAVGKDFELWPGRGGKGQTVFVCDGGPHIRVKDVIVGGSA